MLVINQRKKFMLKLETVYFVEDYESYASKADIILFYLSRKSVPGARAFHTLRFDLTQSEEELFNNINHTTRRRIRQAIQKGEYRIIMNYAPTREEMDKFCESYDEFAGTKGIKSSDRELLLMARERDSLCISFLRDKDGNDLCGTADIHDGKTVLGMYSYSHFRKYADSKIRNEVSNANRYLYWEQLRVYKQKGFTALDMGGLGLGKEGEGLDSVDEFKRSFGGKIETLYHFYLAKSPLGKLMLWATGKNNKIEY